MDTYLIPATILLTLTNLSFAVLALSWRQQARRLQTRNDLLILRWNKHRDRTLADGVALGEQRAYGVMYKAAIKAERAHGDVLAALRTVGRVEDESIVQVPESV